MAKVCNNCGETKELELFQKDKRAALGRRNRCKACSNSLTTAWKRSNPGYMPEYLASYHPEYAKVNRSKLSAKEASRRARKLGQTPQMVQDELDQINYLYWLAQDLRAVSGQDYHVDHIKPLAKGGPTPPR